MAELSSGYLLTVNDMLKAVEEAGLIMEGLHGSRRFCELLAFDELKIGLSIEFFDS